MTCMRAQKPRLGVTKDKATAPSPGSTYERSPHDRSLHLSLGEQDNQFHGKTSLAGQMRIYVDIPQAYKGVFSGDR